MTDHPYPPHSVLAECPACGERRFRAQREAPEPGDIVTCESCGLKLTCAFLRARMGRASVAAAPRPAVKTPHPAKKAPRPAKKAKRKRR
jgi:hypothetical protein